MKIRTATSDDFGRICELLQQLWREKKSRERRSKMMLVSPLQLNLRGFIGISLIGKTAIWTK